MRNHRSKEEIEELKKERDGYKKEISRFVENATSNKNEDLLNFLFVELEMACFKLDKYDGPINQIKDLIKHNAASTKKDLILCFLEDVFDKYEKYSDLDILFVRDLRKRISNYIANKKDSSLCTSLNRGSSGMD